MHRILLADDSPHAQRMGERILRDEGYEVVSVTEGETALLRLADVDPDLILADAFLPGRSGVDICRFVKAHAHYGHVRIVLTAGMLEAFDEVEAQAAGASAILKKPFEASVVLETIKPLLAEAEAARAKPAAAASAEPAPAAEPPAQLSAAVPEPPAGTGVSEEELLRAAVTLALDAAFPALVEDITTKVLMNLRAAGNGAHAAQTAAADLAVPITALPPAGPD